MGRRELGLGYSMIVRTTVSMFDCTRATHPESLR
jgi:hypothetical protein